MITLDQLDTDAFLSEEDLDLRNMTEDEVWRAYSFWLKNMQVTNERDKYLYSHGVFQLIGEEMQAEYDRGFDPFTHEPLNGREPSA